MTRRAALVSTVAGFGVPVSASAARPATGALAAVPPAAAGPLDHVKGLTVRAYGNSYPNWPDRWSYLHRLADDLHWDLTQASVGGDLAMDTAAWAIGAGSPTRWTPGAADLVVVDAALNDALSYGQDGLIGYRNAMRALLGYLTCEGPIDSENLTYSGGAWSTEPSGDRHGGSARIGGTTITAPAFNRAGRWVFGYAGIPRELGQGAVFDLRADGTSVGTIVCDDACRPSARTQLGGGPRRRAAAATVINLPSGATAFTMVRGNGGGGPWFDWYGKINETGSAPLIVLPGPLPLPDYTGTAGSDPVLDAYTQALIGVAAEIGPNCVVVDARPGWNPATMIRPGDIHPTARGHAHIAAAITAVLANVEWWPS